MTTSAHRRSTYWSYTRVAVAYTSAAQLTRTAYAARTTPTRITELFGDVEDSDPLADPLDDGDDDFDVPSFLK